jgi:hypothetical protein
VYSLSRYFGRPANRRQKLGLVWKNRKKISQIINDYLCLPFFLLIILCRQVTEENLVSRCSPSRDLTSSSRAVMESCNDQLVAIATSMNQNLTDLLAIMQVGSQSENQRFGSGIGSRLNQLSGSGSGSGSWKAKKMNHKNREKIRNFMFLKCWIFSFEG